MTRTGMILLSLGTAAFVALLAWQGLGAVAATLASAGWGLALVAAFHLVPLVIDATAIAVMFRPGEPGSRLGEALRARWVGEAVNSLLPAGQIGGPVLMVRYLAQRGAPHAAAAAARCKPCMHRRLGRRRIAFRMTVRLGRIDRIVVILVGIGRHVFRVGDRRIRPMEQHVWMHSGSSIELQLRTGAARTPVSISQAPCPSARSRIAHGS